MKTRRPRRNKDASQRETPFFFSKIDDQTDVETRAQEDFFQPKLTVGKPGDPFEREADRAADSVVDRSPSCSNDVTAVPKMVKVQCQAERVKDIEDRSELQRQAEEEEEEEAVQAQAEEKEEPVQAHGEEGMESVQAQTEEEEESLQAQAEEEEESRAKPECQAKGEDKETTAQANAQGRRGSADVAARLQQQKGRGRPLPPELRAEMEAALDADFGAVRIHTDEEAAQLSKILGAQAFTHGNDIYFGEGTFNPDTRAGKRLLVHELTHVKQQSGREG